MITDPIILVWLIAIPFLGGLLSWIGELAGGIRYPRWIALCTMVLVLVMSPDRFRASPVPLTIVPTEPTSSSPAALTPWMYETLAVVTEASPAGKAALAKKLNSYGKTWHVWDTGHAGHAAAHDLPIGKPLLAWSYNRDGEMPGSLLEERDRRMNVDTSKTRKEREDLAAQAKPQRGVDDLKAKLKGGAAPAGVVAR